ncbi:hypothetical protein V1522DRAFT_394396 [Lipomyces starkeyi]
MRAGSHGHGMSYNGMFAEYSALAENDATFSNCAKESIASDIFGFVDSKTMQFCTTLEDASNCVNMRIGWTDSAACAVLSSLSSHAEQGPILTSCSSSRASLQQPYLFRNCEKTPAGTASVG